jgi:hypothetical protein
MHGSSFLNEAFRAHLKQRLESHRDEIEINGSTLDGILDTAVVDFETKMKRNLDITKKNLSTQTVWISGITANASEGFKHNEVLIRP